MIILCGGFTRCVHSFLVGKPEDWFPFGPASMCQNWVGKREPAIGWLRAPQRPKGHVLDVGYVVGGYNITVMFI